MGSHPTHQDVITTVSQLCGNSITEFEAGLKAQVESDQAAREEIEKAKEKARFAKEAARIATEEAARLALGLAENERKRLAEVEIDNVGFSTKGAAVYTQDAGDEDNNDDDKDKDDREEEEEDGNDSAADEVCNIIYLFYSLLMMMIILGDW
jgi:hypothetical protein